MSGTDENYNDQQSGTDGQETDPQNQQSGTGDNSGNVEALKKEIAELRKEAAKYRLSAKGKETLEEKVKLLQEQFDNAQAESRRVKRESLLDKAGCIKSDLVVKEIPDDCEDVNAWIENYKKENEILFSNGAKSHGGIFKPTGKSSLTPSQQMDAAIRKALGR